jgi:septal ring factor EnvC (AmiA/AmiB activator)
MMDTEADIALKDAEMRFLQWGGKMQAADIGAAALRALREVLDEGRPETQSKIELLKELIKEGTEKCTTFEKRINDLEKKINALQTGKERRVMLGGVLFLLGGDTMI